MKLVSAMVAAIAGIGIFAGIRMATSKALKAGDIVIVKRGSLSPPPGREIDFPAGSEGLPARVQIVSVNGTSVDGVWIDALVLPDHRQPVIFQTADIVSRA